MLYPKITERIEMTTKNPIRSKTPDYILDDYDSQEYVYLSQLKTPQEKLLYARARIGISQKEIASFMNVHQVTVSRIEKDPIANMDHLEKYCECVEVGKGWVIGDKPTRPFDYSVENAPRLCALMRIMESFGISDTDSYRNAAIAFSSGKEIDFIQLAIAINGADVGARLVELRSEIIDVSTREMGKQSSTPVAAVNSTERWVKPHFGYIASLIVQLGVSPEWLLTGSGPVFDMRGTLYQEIKETMEGMVFSIRVNLERYSTDELESIIKTLKNIELNTKTA